MKINTNKLRNMLGHITKVKANPLLEISNYIQLVCDKDGSMRINATDGDNHITVFEDGEYDESIDFIVKTDQFVSLINKTTTENVTLTAKENYLEVKGNGTYKVELVQGEIYPDHKIVTNGALKIDDCVAYNLKHGLNVGKNVKSQTAADGCLFGYLFRNNHIITADAIKVNASDFDCQGLEVLIPPSLANLVQTLSSEKVNIIHDVNNNSIMFKSKNIVISGTLMEGVEEYPESILPMIEETQPSLCVVDTQEFLKALNRIGLFIDIYDMNTLQIAFVGDLITLQTVGGSVESITTKDSPRHEDIVYEVNIKYLQDLVSSVDSPTIDIEYGNPDLIKIVSDKDQMLLSTLDNE
jgi:DNA polymerase III sliding clamp (beta) subunit (PCNA family)